MPWSRGATPERWCWRSDQTHHTSRSPTSCQLRAEFGVRDLDQRAAISRTAFASASTFTGSRSGKSSTILLLRQTPVASYERFRYSKDPAYLSPPRQNPKPDEASCWTHWPRSSSSVRASAASKPRNRSACAGRGHRDRSAERFQPLLYQVATAALSPADIAWPIRHILRKQNTRPC